MTNQYKLSYITDFMCTYKFIEEYEDSFLLYQMQMVQAFNLEKFDMDIVNKITEELYEKYKNNDYISNLIIGGVNKLVSNSDNVDLDIDNLTKFRIFFGYDTFYLLHSLLCSLENNIPVNEEKYNKLLK